MWEVPLVFEPGRHKRDLKAEHLALLDEDTLRVNQKLELTCSLWPSGDYKDHYASCECRGQKVGCLTCELQLPTYLPGEAVCLRAESRWRELGKQTRNDHLIAVLKRLRQHGVNRSLSEQNLLGRIEAIEAHEVATAQ